MNFAIFAATIAVFVLVCWFIKRSWLENPWIMICVMAVCYSAVLILHDLITKV